MTLRENRPAANQGTRSNAKPSNGNTREVEYRLFQKINRALMSAGAEDRTSQNFLDAIEDNRRLWDTMRSDLESESNWLEKDLKVKLISLALWVERHSDLVIESRGEVGPLIAVNQTIMEGLTT